jgi:hypothetical protein
VHGQAEVFVMLCVFDGGVVRAPPRSLMVFGQSWISSRKSSSNKSSLNDVRLHVGRVWHLVEVDGAQLHRLAEVLVEMPRPVHATLVIHTKTEW